MKRLGVGLCASLALAALSMAPDPPCICHCGAEPECMPQGGDQIRLCRVSASDEIIILEFADPVYNIFVRLRGDLLCWIDRADVGDVEAAVIHWTPEMFGYEPDEIWAVGKGVAIPYAKVAIGIIGRAGLSPTLFKIEDVAYVEGTPPEPE